MKTRKNKMTQRFVTKGEIMFAGRVITHPTLEQFNNKRVQVAFDSPFDTTIDIIDHNNSVLVTLENRKVA